MPRGRRCPTAKGASDSFVTAAAVVVLIGLAACGGGSGRVDDDPPPTTEADARSTESSPFTVDEMLVPAGFDLTGLGRGEWDQAWGDDSGGTDSPYLVLSGDGTPDHDEIVIVSLTGYHGYQGGLAQVLRGYLDGPEPLTVDGDEALFSPMADEGPQTGGPRWAELVVARGTDDVAVVVASSVPDADAASLAEVAERVEVPDDRRAPPLVADPPDDLRVVGSVGADAEMARLGGTADIDGVLGPDTAHIAVWQPPGSGSGHTTLSVMTIPGRSTDIAALVVPELRRSDPDVDVTVRWDDDHATVVRRSEGLTGQVHEQRTAWVSAADGDLVVASLDGDELSVEQLLALARSVTPTDAATWETMVAELRGPPGLHVTPGSTEIARGVVGDGREWLLQAPEEPLDGAPTLPDGTPLPVDGCLVVSDGTRSCVGGASARTGVLVLSGWPEPQPTEFALIATTIPDAATVHVTHADGAPAQDVPLADVPGSTVRVAVVHGAEVGVVRCADDHPAGPVTVTATLVDASGDVVACPSP